jgi:hypothetical protein
MFRYTHPSALLLLLVFGGVAGCPRRDGCWKTAALCRLEAGKRPLPVPPWFGTFSSSGESAQHSSPFVRYTEAVFDPDAHVPRPNRSLIYFGACLIAGMRLARERQVNVRVIPIGTAIGESVDLAHEIYNCVFRRVPREMRTKITADDVRVGMED